MGPTSRTADPVARSPRQWAKGKGTMMDGERPDDLARSSAALSRRDFFKKTSKGVAVGVGAYTLGMVGFGSDADAKVHRPPTTTTTAATTTTTTTVPATTTTTTAPTTTTTTTVPPPPSGWDPSKISNAIAYWNADDLTGAGGAAVPSWTDRKAGITLSQATGSAQPTLVTNSGNTGHKAARFASAKSQFLAAGRGAIPDQGPIWLWVIMNIVSSSGQTVPLEVGTPGNAAQGIAFEWNPNMGVAAWGVFDTTVGTGIATGVAEWYLWHWDPVTAQTVWTDYNNLSYPTSATESSQAGSGATTVTLGGSQLYRMYLDAEVSLVVVGSGTPSSSDVSQMATWVWQQYGILTGTGYNAINHTLMPSKGGSGNSETSCLELGGIYNSAGVFGHKYWMASAPGINIDENPNIAFSDDGNTWLATGIKNPLVPYPGSGNGNYSDPSLLDNSSRDGSLYLYYVMEQTASSNGVRYLTSTDGTTWIDQGFTMMGNSSGGPYYECPVVCYDSASLQYWLYAMDLANNVIYRQSASTPRGTWSAQTACSITVPGGRTPWHISAPIKIGSKWVLAFSDSDTARNIWLASSTDGITWKCAIKPLVVPGTSNEWDNNSGGLYRASIQDAQDGKNMLLWYLSNGTGTYYMSDMVTVPQSVIP